MATPRRRPPRSRWFAPPPFFLDPGAVYWRARHQYHALMARVWSAVEPGPKKAGRGRPATLSREEYAAHLRRHPGKKLSDATRAHVLTRELGRRISRYQVIRRRHEHEREADR
jgi:hypothetical protein